MPIDLVLVRHGQSEGNAAVHLSRQGDDSAFTEEFLSRHSGEWRLTDLGIKQAKAAGAWIHAHIGPMFDRYYVSDYIRARETAAHLGLPEATWYREFFLRERDQGELDVVSGAVRRARYAESLGRRGVQPFYWKPPNGESLADVCLRIDRVIQTLHRECADKRVIIVSHGEAMWALRTRLERISQEEWKRLEGSKDPADRINNGQVIHYTRRDPATGEVAPYLNWVRFICPSRPEWSREAWAPIRRQTSTNEELLAEVETYPRIFHGEY